MELQLGDVQETALIPLVIRANETRRENARIHDEKAVKIINALEIDRKDLDKFFSHEGVVARTIMFDNTVKKLLVKYPGAVCVNIGCGLDDRFSRVDNGSIRWFSVDLPDSIAVRKMFFQETEREVEVIEVNASEKKHNIDKVVVSPIMITIYTSYPELYNDNVNYEVVVFSEKTDNNITFQACYGNTEGKTWIPRNLVGDSLFIYVVDSSSFTLKGKDAYDKKEIEKHAIVSTHIYL